MIRWKVVDRNRNSYIIGNTLKRNKYTITYTPGIIKAIPDTLGIFVFRHKRDALSWIGTKAHKANYMLLLKVNPIGNLKKVPGALPNMITMDLYYKNKENINIEYYLSDIPFGTMLYDSVEVLT